MGLLLGQPVEDKPAGIACLKKFATLQSLEPLVPFIRFLRTVFAVQCAHATTLCPKRLPLL